MRDCCAKRGRNCGSLPEALCWELDRLLILGRLVEREGLGTLQGSVNVNVENEGRYCA
jgi:hypothetical protein